MSTEIAKTEQLASDLSVFGGNSQSFEHAQRVAKALSTSSLIPKEYQGNDKIGNILIALELAQRTNASPLMVMQNLYIVHGKPSWSGQFIIAAINSSGKFSPLRFEQCGTTGKPDWGMRAWATELATGEKLYSPWVTMAMATAEGWVQKNGSKWQTMPELMLHYRTATFFGRLYAPEILMGMRTEGEIEDVEFEEVKPISAQSLKEKISKNVPIEIKQETVQEPAINQETITQVATEIKPQWDEILTQSRKFKVKYSQLLTHVQRDNADEVTQEDINLLNEIIGALKAGTLTAEKAFTEENAGKTKEEILFGSKPL